MQTPFQSISGKQLKLCGVAVLILTILGINFYFYAKEKSREAQQISTQKALKDAELAKADKIEREAKLAKEAEAVRQANAIKRAVKEQQRIAAELEYIERHINTNRSKNTTGKTLAIAVVEKNQMQVGVVQDALESHFKGDSIQLLTSFLKPAFFADGMVEDILNGTGNVPSRLKLDTYVDALILAKYHVEFETNTVESQLLTTANIKFTVTLLPFVESVHAHTWDFLATGNGFKTMTAQANANEKLIKQIKESSMAVSQ